MKKRLNVMMAALIGALGAMHGIGVQAADPAPAQAGSLAEALTDGKLLLNLRPRYEFVDQDGKSEDAKGITLRTLVGWQTKPWYGLSVTAEAINVGHLWDEEFNDTKNKKTKYPTIADPENTDFNQLYLDYTGLPDTRLRVGKQSIKLDNVRFVGNVEFRQVMQVFTGVGITNKSIPGLELYGAHMWRIKNIFAEQHSIRAELLHADWSWIPGNHLIGYGYFLDQPKTVSAIGTGLADNSNQVLGVRADGAYPISADWKVLYTAEYAKQEDYKDGDSRIDADYNHFGVGGKWKDYFVRLDYEKLGSNDGKYGFQTPLGTNHLFQGWVDLFLTTPAKGIQDTWISAGAPVGPVKLYAEYHWLRSDFGSINYGKEFDFGATWTVRKDLLAKFEFGQFKEDDILTPASARKRDTTKLWLTLQYNYQ